jgi:hypothetical protein
MSPWWTLKIKKSNKKEKNKKITGVRVTMFARMQEELHCSDDTTLKYRHVQH